MGSPITPKLLGRFYEVLVLLRVLSHVQGVKIGARSSDDPNLDSIDAIEMRRMVMTHLCTMSDFRKGGETVTAMAAENLPSGPCYWIAANGSVKKIERFLQEVLKLLETRGSLGPRESDSSFELHLFQMFVDFQQARIKQYWRILQASIGNEMKRIGPPSHADAKAASMR